MQYNPLITLAFDIQRGLRDKQDIEQPCSVQLADISPMPDGERAD